MIFANIMIFFCLTLRVFDAFLLFLLSSCCNSYVDLADCCFDLFLYLIFSPVLHLSFVLIGLGEEPACDNDPRGRPGNKFETTRSVYARNCCYVGMK